MTTVVPADEAILRQVVATTPLVEGGLDRAALLTCDAAQGKTPWALRHRRRFALVESGEVLASAERYDLTGRLAGQPVVICGIAAVPNHDAADGGSAFVASLVDQLVEDATRDGADMALLFRKSTWPSPGAGGFEVMPTTPIELTVTESARRGAPMVLVRGGEDRDLDAIAAMGQVRATPFRFHLDRDADFIKYAIVRKRLLAGLAPPGVRRLEVVIAEEGITAAAYIVLSVGGGTWVIEECGDRDSSGARVGALLQALIAREPAESRPVIRGWLPPGFLPPQLAVTAASATPPVLFSRPLSSRVQGLRWSVADALYWLADVF